MDIILCVDCEKGIELLTDFSNYNDLVKFLLGHRNHKIIKVEIAP